MKKIYALLLCLCPLALHAQQHLYISFDDTTYKSLVSIDTAYHHNNWQVGAPHKTVFTSAYTSPNAIVTDTAHPYTSNDTSVFIMKIPRADSCLLFWPGLGPLLNVNFHYQLNINSGTIARLEISVDTGHHWFNVKDSLPHGYSWNGTDTTKFDTSTTGWQPFRLETGWSFTHQADTDLFRFTFISDSAHSGKDGWIIDAVDAEYYCEGLVPQVHDNNLITVYPNPSAGSVYIQAKQSTGTASVTIYDMLGRQVYAADKLPATSNLDLHLPDGTYILKYVTATEYATQRLVIQR